MTDIILGLTTLFLGGCFIIQQIQLIRMGKIVNTHQQIIDITVRQQDILIKMIEAVPGNPNVKRAVRIGDPQ